MPPRTDEEDTLNSSSSMMVANNQSEITTTTKQESCPVSPSSVVVTSPHGSHKGSPPFTTLDWNNVRSEPLQPRSSSSSNLITMTNDNLTIQVSKVLHLTTTTTTTTTTSNTTLPEDNDDESQKVMVHIDKVSHTNQHMGLAHGHASIRLQLVRGGPLSPPRQVRFSPNQHDILHHPTTSLSSPLEKEIQVLEAQCIQLNSALPIHTTNVDAYTSYEYGTNITTLMLHFPTYETTPTTPSSSSSLPLVQIELVLA